MPTTTKRQREKRDKKILADYNSGLDTLDIAKKYGLTQARISQICLVYMPNNVNPIVQAVCKDRELRLRLIEEAAKEGSPLTQQAINCWRKLKDGIPAKRVQLVARLTGLPMHAIRPDLYQQEQEPALVVQPMPNALGKTQVIAIIKQLLANF
jgi:uncharacterized protein YpbB